MNPAQIEITDAGILTGPFSCILSMPTGSGKTWLAQKAIQATVQAGGRAVYLTPLRALAAEVADRWASCMEGTSVGVFTGDFGPNRRAFPVPFDKAQVLVMTPERLDACTRAWRSHWNWIPEVELLVVDEIHQLSESNRGPRLEGALSRFRRLNPFCRLIGLSATLENSEDLANWFDGVAYRSQWRPIPLEWRIARFRKPTEKPSVLIREVSRNVINGGKSLVFVQSRRRAEEISDFLNSQEIRTEHHHAGLLQEQRRDTEAAFRAGNLDVLVATGTLEMGLNLPVRQVVLYDLQTFDGRNFVPLSTNSVWQRVGRAGRPGLDDQGEAVLICPTWDKNAECYELGRFEPVRSQLTRSASISEQIITEVASGAATSRSQLDRAFRQTLGGHQGLITDLDRTISTMCEAGLVLETKESDRPLAGLVLKATRAGRVAVRHMLMPETVLTIQRAIKAFPDLSYFDLLTVIAATNDCEPVLAVDFEELDEFATALGDELSFLLRRPLIELREILGVSSRRLLSALKMAYTARRWTRLGDAQETSDSCDCYPFEVTRLAESMSRLLHAMTHLYSVTSEDCDDQTEVDDEPTLLERIVALQKMVAFGLNETAVSLCFVQGIGGTFARRLVTHGVHDIEDLAGAEAEELAEVKGLSNQRAEHWIAQAEKLIKSHYGSRLRDRGPRATCKKSEWPHNIDPYRLRRSLDLKVQKLGLNAYRVTGGLEAHDVTLKKTIWHCDCMDHLQGIECKHLLAVKKCRRDPSIVRLVKLLTTEPAAEGLDLFQLWLDGERVLGRAQHV